MALDFPSSPNAGATYTASGVTWVWDGAKWEPSVIASGPFVPLSGATMAGPLLLFEDPQVPLEAVTKEYADAIGNYAVGNSYASGYVNKFRNPGFDVWQRGNNLTGTTAGTWCADGWIVVTAAATCAVSHSGLLIAGASKNSMSIQGNTGVTGVTVMQRIESIDAAILAGQTCTFQMLIFNNSASPMVPVLSVSHPTTVDNFQSAAIPDLPSTSLQSIPAGANGIVSYTWNQPQASQNLGMVVFISFPGTNLNTTAQAIAISMADIRVTPGLPVGLNNNPPPVEHRSYQAEWAYCQRYFQVGQLISGAVVSAASQTVYMSSLLPTPMRATPTIAPTSVNMNNLTGLAGGAYGGYTVYLQGTSIAAGAFVFVASFTANAEL